MKNFPLIFIKFLEYYASVNYAFLSNGITSALESQGSIDWFPVPRFDSQSIFTKILDNEKGGYFSVRPEEYDRIQEEYIGYSLILKTTFKKNELKAMVIDFLPISLPAIIRLYDTELPLEVNIIPVFNYALINAGTEIVKDGVIYRNPLSKEGIELLVYGNYEIISPYKLIIKPGKGYLYLLYSKDLRYGLFSQKGFVYSKPYEAFSKLIALSEKELSRAKRIRKTERFKDIYYRSISVLLGLLYRPSGGIIASPTTSLPEIIGMERNWDYRYVWVRDASYATEALIKANLLTQARRSLDFIISVIDPSSKSFDHPLYTIDGTAPPAEENLDWISGFKNSKPVRVGNAAYLQIQMDIEGAFMHTLHEYYKETQDDEYIDSNYWAIEAIATWVKSYWREPSTDIWEERGVTRHYVHTKLMSWVALDRAYKLAEALGYKKEAEEWKSVANEIKEDVMIHGIVEGSFVRYYGGNEIDSALLTLPLYDFVDANDKIFLNTLRRIENELKIEDGLYLRYKKDFLGSVVHPFALVTPWMARVYIRLNKVEDAIRLLEKLDKCSNSLKLLGEHIDQKSCEARGNFPHSFPHAGIILSIIELEEKLNAENNTTNK
ncbi:glycoside hydrolase family 15 protein [Sulfolobus sp. S-194]|uniref:alpha,alpha-trehalase TreH2 n=1 Tax=Sulfolobus sp. S-194 TaxID=2512240 RepID=UPI001436F898|nr:alpha,alpha-trehalase TreH2 [Sulfolobus sp. S-194]QIW25337.1 glycoside hydrolase family 15 protein [Sulfolobus sp. S-194]